MPLKIEKIPVSVVIPTYNRTDQLARAINSVFNQSVSCEEIIIVDDGSTDTTLEDLTALLKSCQGIKVRIFTQDNRGPAAARNLGIRMARFEMIAFLDSDDHWHRKKLQVQYALLADCPANLISHTQERWLRNGLHLNQKKHHRPLHGDIFNHCLQLCAVGISTVMLKKALIEQVGLFDESMRCCEDYDFWLRVSCRYPFILANQALTTKEGGRADQISCQYRIGMDRFRIESLLRLLQSKVLSSCQEQLTRKELMKKCRIYGSGCLKHGKVEEGNRYLNLLKALEDGVTIAL